MTDVEDATGYRIRLAEICDAPAYVETHTRALIETYSHIMPAEFGPARMAEIENYTNLRVEAFTRMRQALDAGVDPETTHWVAVNSSDEVVGVAATGPGRPPWDHMTDMAQPPVAHQLDHIYTLASTHGSGLGQRLLETALPNHVGAHLWVLSGNPRAESFYRRNRFVPDGSRTLCGELWFSRPMFRMWRPELSGSASQN